MSTLGMRIKMARAKESQSTYAGRLQISKGALGFYERDENQPKTDVILKICTLSGVNLDWLLTGNGPMRPSVRSRPFKESGGGSSGHPESCGLCGRLESELEAERQERRELNIENRKLWQEVSQLREENAMLRGRMSEED